jgi:hypothetical protein
MGGEAPSEQGVVESALAVATLEDASSDGGEESDMDDDDAEARLQALTARLEEVNYCLPCGERACVGVCGHVCVRVRVHLHVFDAHALASKIARPRA